VITIAELFVSPPVRHSDAAGGLMFYRRCSFLIISPLSFDNGCTDLNTDCCVNAVDETVPMAKNLVNFGQGTLP